MAGRRLGPHVTRLWSGLLASVALLVAVTGVVILAFLLPPIRFEDGAQNVLALAVFVLTAVLVAVLGARSRRAVLQSRRLSEEQSALRRVATLVAQSVPASAVFEAVTEEVGLLCGADLARMERYEEDGTVTGVAAWATVSDQLAVGTRFHLDGPSVAREVLHTGAPVRLGDFGAATGDIAREAQGLGIRSSVGCPIVVAGHLWGVIAASTTREEPFPGDTEAQIGGFTELVATAIANAQAREELRTIVDEQAALRRVATLVARGAPPLGVFAAVAQEVGQVLPAFDYALVGRYDPDRVVEIVGAWQRTGKEDMVGLRRPLGGRNVSTLVFERNQPSRVDQVVDDASAVTAAARERGVRSSAGAPINVEGRLWGVMTVASMHDEVLPHGTEHRLAEFTQLVATAIANAEAHAELTASRARIVAASDETRRRMERDLHDGAQQRLVSLALQLRAAQAAVPAELDELAAELDRVAIDLTGALDELREYARGIHPGILSEGGLGPALRTLARRSPVPVQLDVSTLGRLPERVEVATYYVVSEALTNAAKHANASVVHVAVDAAENVLRVLVRDDGVGGADPTRGSGLVGLKDRVEATGGTLIVHSTSGDGTRLVVELPVDLGDLTRRN